MKKDNENTATPAPELTSEQKLDLIDQLTVEQLGVVEGGANGPIASMACVEQICDRNISRVTA